ncbi:RNA recognition motif 2-domain-containing protein [Chaetomium sp. MPI-CAGE-AT-0009]|nr:RNA recognition motif 2-domain-containing protein [Chaetomium sp. MPI-CAGE-AT-0009]
MAHVRDASFNPSSPHSSSGGVDSYNYEGTPDTKLTVFSPDENSAKSNRLLTTLDLDGPSTHTTHYHVGPAEGFGNTSSATTEKDPFVSNTTTKGEQKLSPTASAFRPLSVPLVAHGSLNASPGVNAGHGVNRQLFAPQATAKFSCDLGISRCLVLYSPSFPITVTDAEGYLAVCGPMAQVDPICDGKIQITAFDEGVNFGAVHVETVVHTFLETQGEVFALLRQSEANDQTFRASVEFSDADIAISVVHKFNRATLGGVHLILTLCQLNGTTTMSRPVEGYNLPLNDQQTTDHNIASAFHGMGASENAQQPRGPFASGRFNQSPAQLRAPQQYAVYPVVYHGLPSAASSRLMLNQTPTRGQSVTHITPMTPISGNMPIMTPMFNTTPPDTPMAMHGDFTSPRSMQPYGRHGLDTRRHAAMRVNRTPYFNNAGHHNHVDVNRIRDGIDVRTTIMLRNIPNKVDQAMLKRIVDESSWGKYDFMYLRIDFANDCNVGYAFINFVDPLDIIDFVNARGNQRWNCFKSDKVAEISYATIQGKDCLVQKFRNSSVMLEAPHYRPKLYFTCNGPRPDLAGQEEPFPEPDNQSKMKRSCENAEHVGE